MNERDPELDALWRRHSREEPPAALDAAIRAAAHRAVHAKPAAASPRARAPWPAWATLAAAASIGAIAIGVWQLQPHDVDETTLVASDMPRSAPAPANAGRRLATPEAPPAHDATTAAPGDATSAPRPDARRETVAPSTPPHQVALDAAKPRVQSSARSEPVPSRGEATRTPEVAALEANQPSPFPGTAGRIVPSARDAAPPEQSEGGGRSAYDARSTLAAQAPPAAASPVPEMPAPPAAADADVARALPRFAEPAAKVAGAQASADAKSATSAMASHAAGAPAAARARMEKSAAPRSVNDFVDAIRRALAERRDDDARADLVAMRAQYGNADAQLPADLRAWAAGVPRARP